LTWVCLTGKHEGVMTAPSTAPVEMLHPLTRYRQRHNLTLVAFAAQVGTTAGTISRIETGAKEPSVGMLRQLLAATRGEVSADDIISFQPADSGRAA
jgi:transcriptional regulator with XRE-family HTH domain